MEAGGDALRGVKTTDVKTVKQVSSKSELVVVWYGEEDTEVSGSEGRESSQTASVRENAKNMEAGGDALRGVQTAVDKTVKQVCIKSELVVVWYGEKETEASGSGRREKHGG